MAKVNASILLTIESLHYNDVELKKLLDEEVNKFCYSIEQRNVSPYLNECTIETD